MRPLEIEQLEKLQKIPLNFTLQPIKIGKKCRSFKKENLEKTV
jgi:hypothetical protein